jgi:hypothetical protein
MTFNNSVLVIIKQTPGIDYNDLLSKVSSRYATPASAKSALARALKDMTSFGLIKREGSKVFITSKGLSSINLEIKDKLVFRLNEEFKKRSFDFDEIVKLLVVLNQRASKDKSLFNNARENSSFTINDIEQLCKNIRAQRKHLKKMSLLLQQQAQNLKTLDFNDSIELPFDSVLAAKISLFCNEQKIVVETKDSAVLEKIPAHWIKQDSISVEKEGVALLMQLLSSVVSAKAMLYTPILKIRIGAGKAYIFGSHSAVKSFLDFKINPFNEKSEKGV